MIGNTSNKFSLGVRSRAVRLVLEDEHTSHWATISCTAQTLSEWIKRA